MLQKTAFSPLLLALFFCPALAETKIDLNAEASVSAANDMVRATVFVESNGADPAQLAKTVNQEINEALKISKAKQGIKVKTGHQYTSPIYGKSQKIESWRMHAELELESRDAVALSALLGELQQMRVAIGNVQQMPSPETQKKAEDDATRAAIEAFRGRAALVAGVFNKPYKIKQLNINQQGGFRPVFMRQNRGLRMGAMDAAESAPLEAGETQITTNVSGQIELPD